METYTSIFLEDRPILADKNSEKFSLKLCLILVFVHISALPALFFFSPFNIAAWACAHFLFATIGLSIGNHRLISHRSFEPVPWLKNFILLMATLCFQGGPLFWGAGHRMHHRFTEKFGDPHSATRGFFWSHIQWMCYRNPNGFSYSGAKKLVGDWRKDKFAMFLERQNLAINVGFLALTLALCFLSGRPGLFFWIGPLRILSVWHATWLINSYAHSARLRKGRAPSLRDSIVMSLILGGEGNHAFHHKIARSPKHCYRNWNLDYGYLILRIWKAVGLVKYRSPEAAAQDVRRRIQLEDLLERRRMAKENTNGGQLIVLKESAKGS